MFDIFEKSNLSHVICTCESPVDAYMILKALNEYMSPYEYVVYSAGFMELTAIDLLKLTD